ncbi:MAG: hypothetical protein K8R67_00330 [Desulfobacteraceae bacterium]|nr:hypothetical protein [Desulfobacteraceae bacterium]
MKNRKQIGLFLMNEKGYSVLKMLCEQGYGNQIKFVESRENLSVKKDFYKEIKDISEDNKIPFFMTRTSNMFLHEIEYGIAIGWRWIINGIDKLIIIHDSLLPKYRGFSPVVNALINGEETIGATALWAKREYDKGNIILQKKISINYPIKIQQVIKKLCKVYIDIVFDIFDKINNSGSLPSKSQDEEQATYSIWRDETDYFIDWRWTANQIERFVDAVSYPYDGAKTIVKNDIITIEDCCVYTQKNIVETNHYGKVISFDSGCPVVICGSGLIKIIKMTINEKEYKCNKIRTKFVAFQHNE